MILTHRLAVKFKVWDDDAIDGVVASLGGTVINRTPVVRWVLIEIDESRAADIFLAYERHPLIEDVTFDAGGARVLAYNAAANDPMLPSQIAHAALEVFHAWRTTRGENCPPVAFVDTGILGPTYSADFSGKTIRKWNSYYNAATIVDSYSVTIDAVSSAAAADPHGMATMAVACGNCNDNVGPAGIAPGVPELVAMCAWSVPDSNGDGGLMATAYSQAMGIVYAIQRYGAAFVSTSMTTGFPDSAFSGSQFESTYSYWKDAIDLLLANGGVLTVAAGNDRTDALTSPVPYADYRGQLAVGSSCYDEEDRPSYYTSYGPAIKVVVPSHTAWATYYNDGTHFYRDFTGLPVPANWVSPYGTMAQVSSGVVRAYYDAFQGTSCAAPMVMGILALIKSANPALTGQQCTQILLDTGRRGRHWEFLQKFPNAVVPRAGKAVKAALAMAAANATVVYPYVGFYGRGVKVNIVSGTATTDLHGLLDVEIDGLAADAITRVELWAGTDPLYSGPPRRSLSGTMIQLDAARLAGKTVRVVAYTATHSGEESYTDVVGHA